ncbi:3-dehydroquinate synthase [Haliangium sp.]|uniref:3-dehydroquinate synthase n=1 Tax=Haliangium sp. TaxID=2663208 RepID=UPI003D135F96
MSSEGRRHVFLTGFMATGKSTVGRHLAARLGRPFVDLDLVIEERAGADIPTLFGREGEAGFRRREADALAEVVAGPAAVVATGGGAACHGDNLARMRTTGVVVALTAPLDVIRARVEASAEATERPLFQRPVQEVAALLAQRTPIYRQAHACVRTEQATPEALAQHIVALVACAETLPAAALARASVVALAREAYPVVVMDGALGQLGRWIDGVMRTRPPTRAAVVSDSNVAPLYADAAVSALAAAGIDASVHVVPAGEVAKCFAELSRLIDELVGAGLDRSSVVVALGGGVVGDLAGFAAACLYRGVACVQVPTTILAMVDSAIGGKTGIDIDAGKNLAGAFWQPRLVAADPQVLATLPARERRAGFGEILKYALLDGEELYGQVDALAPALAGSVEAAPPALDERVAEALAAVILRCAAIKSWIVTRDEREQTGERALLNLGHTVGHAIEAAAGYGRILHGEAVALGLVASCRVSARLGLCDPGLEARVAASVRRAGLDADLDAWFAASPNRTEAALGFLAVDKKRSGAEIGFVTVTAVGDCGVTRVDKDELARILLS